MKLLIVAISIIHPLLNSFSLGNTQEYPFTVIENRIIIHIDTLNFIFDTGAPISLLDSTLGRKIGAPFNNDYYINTPPGLISVISTDFRLSQFPDSKNWGLMPFDSIDRSLGYRVHGIIGAANVLINKIIDINFKNEIISIYAYDVNPNNCPAINYELIANNNSLNNESIGRFFPISPAMTLPLIFNQNDTIITNLIIDTGCQYAFAFISNDSTIINSISKEKKEYTNIKGFTSKINYGKVSYKNTNQNIISFSPIFYSPSLTNPINNNFYGLLGVPFLQQFERIIINWPKRKICFNK